MYESFFGFSEKPFALQPDPDFLFLSKRHGMALNMLEYGLQNRAGITLITGEIGSGKTTLVRAILNRIGDDVVVGLISNTHAAFGKLMQWIGLAFDLPLRGYSPAMLYARFEKFLLEQYAAGKRVVLIVDEAQNLNVSMLEELRLLTNINSDKDQLLQLVLIGQPELRQTLRQPELRQFAQRISVDYRLAALEPAETDAYIQHRLKVAGGDEATFEPAARRFIHYQAGGIPRVINVLCDTALVYGFAEQVMTIRPQLVYEMIIERLGDELFGVGTPAATREPEADRLLKQALAEAVG